LTLQMHRWRSDAIHTFSLATGLSVLRIFRSPDDIRERYLRSG
jgi:hypothetical protein